MASIYLVQNDQFDAWMVTHIDHVRGEKEQLVLNQLLQDYSVVFAEAAHQPEAVANRALRLEILRDAMTEAGHTLVYQD
jgi:hypothetical protein